LWLIAAPADAALTDGPRLAAIYDAILNAGFDRAEQELVRACPPVPAEACETMRLASLWWQILMNPESRRLDSRFERAADAAVASTRRWTEREPKRGEAWFYVAAAHAPLAQWRVLRGQRLAAARDGKRIKDALERALALDPSLHDAYFGIGLYHYYADVAPSGLKILRFLLLLPGGDRQRGMAEMRQARDRGQLLQGEADFQLHYLYLWYERQPQRALDLLRSLDARYPANPVFLQRIAEVHDDYLHDDVASLATWRALLARARRESVHAPARVEIRARLGIAARLIDLSQADRALADIEKLVAERPTDPHGGLARAYFLLGAARDQLGMRDLARTAYRNAIAHAPPDDPSRVTARARAALRSR
jgi:Tfp pilus assembly protein PilF